MHLLVTFSPVNCLIMHGVRQTKWATDSLSRTLAPCSIAPNVLTIAFILQHKWQAVYSSMEYRLRSFLSTPHLYLCNTAKSNYLLRQVRTSVRPSVCLSVRMEQRGSHSTNFDQILYLSSFRKLVQKIQVSLKSDDNNGYLTRRRFHVYDNI